MRKMRLTVLMLFLLMAMVLIVNGCANNDGEIEYLYLDEAPTVRISTEALEVLADSSEPYTLTYTARTS